MNKSKVENGEVIDGYKIEIDNENECFRLLKIDGIKTSEGVEDEWVANIFDMDSFNTFITNALNQQREKLLGELNIMLSLGDEIVEEASPNYEDGDNELYTIVDWNINAMKLRRAYPEFLTKLEK